MSSSHRGSASGGVHASLHAGALLALRALWSELHPPETEAPSPPPQE